MDRERRGGPERRGRTVLRATSGFHHRRGEDGAELGDMRESAGRESDVTLENLRNGSESGESIRLSSGNRGMKSRGRNVAEVASQAADEARSGRTMD
jgi:hypothetical protein